MGQWQILAETKLREVWNHRLRFGRSGVWFILMELIGPVTIIFWLELCSAARGSLSAAAGHPGFPGGHESIDGLRRQLQSGGRNAVQ